MIMDKENKYNENFTEEEESSFDILGWVLKIVHYWYLFVISLAICIGIAYLKNKSWKPVYKTSARIILGENESGISSSVSEYNFMQGFGGSYASRNMTNQLILFSSRNIISRTISQLNFTVDYYTKSRFKTNFLYKISPVEIVNYTIETSGFGREFILIPIDENSFQVKLESTNGEKGFVQEAKYGLPVNALFHYDSKTNG